MELGAENGETEKDNQPAGAGKRHQGKANQHDHDPENRDQHQVDRTKTRMRIDPGAAGIQPLPKWVVSTRTARDFFVDGAFEIGFHFGHSPSLPNAAANPPGMTTETSPNASSSRVA